MTQTPAQITVPAPACPKFNIGQRVSYLDHTDRPHTGTVRNIEATWRQQEPFIQYSVSHPTYRNKKIYLGEHSMTAVPTC